MAETEISPGVQDLGPQFAVSEEDVANAAHAHMSQIQQQPPMYTSQLVQSLPEHAHVVQAVNEAHIRDSGGLAPLVKNEDHLFAAAAAVGGYDDHHQQMAAALSTDGMASATSAAHVLHQVSHAAHLGDPAAAGMVGADQAYGGLSAHEAAVHDFHYLNQIKMRGGSPHHTAANVAHHHGMAHANAAALYGHTAHAMHPHPAVMSQIYGGGVGGGMLDRGGYTGDGLTSQKAVAFLAGPRERIHVFGNPVECCPRCQHEGIGNTSWRPHRHIGELKIRYICERHFDDLESNHHFDIPLCPLCGQVLYIYEFNGMLGVSSARRLHKYVLKCANRHVLPLLDLFCQTKKGGERCNSNFKLQWSYGTMVKRCESQKNRDHDLWWVRYKNEWKQRRTIIRYKKDFLRHLSDVQRAMLLGLGVEGEAPPDPKSVLGPTYDALVAAAGGAPSSPKIKKRRAEHVQVPALANEDELDFDLGGAATKRQLESANAIAAQMNAAGFALGTQAYMMQHMH